METQYADVIAKTTGMVNDKAVQRLAKQHKLHVLDVTWEDTARFDNSAGSVESGYVGRCRKSGKEIKNVIRVIVGRVHELGATALSC